MATLNQTLETHKTNPEQLKTLAYIRHLASMCNINIMRWNITALFENEKKEDNFLLTNKKEINKRFFAKYQELKSKEAIKGGENFVEDIPELIEALRTNLEKNLENKKARLRQSIDNNVRCSRDAYCSFEQYLQSVTKSRMELNKLNSEDPFASIKKGLQDVLKEDCWVNPIVQGKYLYLNTKNKVVLSQKNKAAGIDLETNLGYLAVKIDLSSFECWVIPYKDNIRSTGSGSFHRSGFFHPHVDINGHVCWGDAFNNYSLWRGQLELGKILKILYSLLHSYSDSNPYIPLATLHTNNEKYGRPPEFLKHPDKSRPQTAAKENENVLSAPLSPPIYTTPLHS